jgi:hypothetical protein
MGQINKSLAELNAILSAQSGVLLGDDAGNTFAKQVSVGQPDAGAELVIGEGDSYPVTKAFHVDTANISGLTVTSATDITDILQSDSSSTTGLFGSTASGKCLLVMSEVGRYGGVKAKMNTAGTVEASSIVAEYLQDNSPTWIQTAYMATDAEFPYDQKGNVLASCSSCSEQWRFTLDPDNTPPQWDLVTLTIDGTPYTGRWARIRTIAPITLDPILEQIKLHTNRWECNADGNTEYFGRARYPRDIRITKYTNVNKNPANENISVASGVTLAVVDNEFTAAADDGNIYTFTIPIGLDTSIPIYIEKRFYPMGTGAGDIIYNCNVYKIKTGTVLDGTLTPASTLTNTISVNNQQDELIKTTFKFFVADLVPGDSIVLDVHREGSNVLDTFGSSIADVGGRAIAWFWRP